MNIKPPFTVDEELVTDIELKVIVLAPVTYRAPPFYAILFEKVVVEKVPDVYVSLIAPPFNAEF